jgi:HAD superfamily hydrolase (TIGR01549 family)
MTAQRPTPTPCKAVIFDMDGTLTRPALDFDEIRREIGLGNGPILEALPDMPADQRARAEAILRRHEDRAAARSELQPGAADVVAAVRAAGMSAALMTRNSARSVKVFQTRHGIDFDLLRTRDDGPMKPSPEPILAICRSLGVAPDETWSVGDFHYDLLCGAAAGSTTVLLLDADGDRPGWADEADYVIHALPELLTHLGLGDESPS